MTWEEANQLLVEQQPLIAKPLPHDYWHSQAWQARVHQLFADEQKWKPTIDATMRQFAAQRTWPELPAGPLNFLVGCRLMCARSTLEILLVEPSVVHAARGATDCALLEWLLLATWNEWRWDEFLKLQALASLSAVLYALPPLPPTQN